MGEAFKIAQMERDSRTDHVLPLRDYLIESILETVPNSKLTGHPVDRLPNHASFVFKNIDGNELLMMLDVEGFSCSSGSACRSGDPKESEVIKSLSLEEGWGMGSLRVTLGTGTTKDQIESFCEVLPQIINRIRNTN
jgi:cysteine desulfurase